MSRGAIAVTERFELEHEVSLEYVDVSPTLTAFLPTFFNLFPTGLFLPSFLSPPSRQQAANCTFNFMSTYKALVRLDFTPTAELPVAMHTNLEVAELVALLRRHGISPDEARANSSRSAVPTAAALSSSAAAGTNAANPPAPANEPEEAPSGRSSTQYECWLTMIFRRDWLRPLYQLSCPNRALRCPRRCCCRQRGSGCCSGCWC